jgi:hypothetical protein
MRQMRRNGRTDDDDTTGGRGGGSLSPTTKWSVTKGEPALGLPEAPPSDRLLQLLLLLGTWAAIGPPI